MDGEFRAGLLGLGGRPALPLVVIVIEAAWPIRGLTWRKPRRRPSRRVRHGTAVTNSIGMELMLIPAGEFAGSPGSDKDARRGRMRKPQHRVRSRGCFTWGD